MRNKQILQNYVKLGEFIAKCYGENVEVAVHDISDLNHSAIAVYNGHVSGRTVGAPMTYFGLSIIRDKLYEKSDYVTDTHTELQGGKVLRSSTYFIKNPQGELIGTLCVNVDVSSYVEMSDVLRRLAFGGVAAESRQPGVSEQPANPREQFPTSVSDMIEATLQEYIGNSGISIDTLTAEKKVEAVKKLSEKGIFVIKGTVREVSKALGMSESTVYRYLSIINSEHGK